MNIQNIDIAIVNDLIDLGTQLKRNFIQELIIKFELDYTKRMQLLQKSINENELEVFHHQVHQIKGAAAALGLKKMAEHLKKMKQVSIDPALSQKNIDELNQIYISSIEMLKDYISS